MWKGIALVLLAACASEKQGPTEPLGKQVLARCGMPPRMNAMEMTQGLPPELTGENAPQMVVMDAEAYRAMLKWRDCVGLLK